MKKKKITLQHSLSASTVARIILLLFTSNTLHLPSNIVQTFWRHCFDPQRIQRTVLSLDVFYNVSRWSRGNLFKSPLPLPYSVKFPTPISTTDIKFPAPGAHLLDKCPEHARGVGCWCLYLIDALLGNETFNLTSDLFMKLSGREIIIALDVKIQRKTMLFSKLGLKQSAEHRKKKLKKSLAS